MFKFDSPYVLLFIPIVIAMFFLIKKSGSIRMPSISPISKMGLKTRKHLLGKYIIMSAIILMLVALARPQFSTQNKNIKKEGIDIVVALDLSQSMMQTDFSPNRLERAKYLLNKFIDKRPDDRLSLIVFGGDAYTKVPLTFDHSMIKEITKTLTINDITSNDRTAIGMGLGIAINRLKNSTAKSKVIILMTDGENNSGEMNPISAAKIAKELGIKVYTIGIGAHEVRDGFFMVKNSELDENLLKNIAKITGGEYFRADSEKNFANIFNKINSLEKTKIEGRVFYTNTELYENILILALILLLIGVYFEYFRYIKIP